MTTVGVPDSHKTRLARVQLIRCSASIRQRSVVLEVGSLAPAESMQIQFRADGVRAGSDV